MKRGEHLFPPLSVALLCENLPSYLGLLRKTQGKRQQGRSMSSGRAQSLAGLGLHTGFGTQMHSARVRTVAGIGMRNVLCMQVSLEAPFPALLLSCMAVIYFVIIPLKFLVGSF